MNIREIRWVNRSPSAGIDAEEAYTALEVIRANGNGTLKQPDIVQAAKSKRHVLHDWFQWDDTAAAATYRQQQAGQLIRCIEVVYEERPEVPTRMYQVDVKKTNRSVEPSTYMTTEEMLADPDKRNILLQRAYSEVQSIRNRYQALEELSHVFEAIDALPAV